MTRKQLDQCCEWGVIGLIIGVLIYAPLAIGGARPFDFAILQSLTALALLVWSLRFWLNKNHRLLWPPVCWAILAFVALAFFRYQSAELEYVARYEFIRILVYAAIFFLAINNLHKQETTQVIVFVLLTVATLTSLYAVYQYFTQAEFIWSYRRPDQYLERGSGTYICPNHFAGFLEMVLPLGIAYLFAGRYNYTFKVFLGYACLVIMAGLAATMSRGGWLASGISLLLLFALLLRKRQYRLPALVALAIFGIAATVIYQRSDKLQDRIQNMNEGGSTAFVSARPAIWKAAWKMFKDHQLWGVGPGHFDYRFPQYRPESIQVRPGWVHNDYLNTLVDWGIVGASVVGLGMFMAVVGVLQSRKYVERASKDIGSQRNSNRAAFVLGSIASGCALAIHSFFDFNLHVAANAIIATTLLALAASHLRFASGRYWLSSWPGSKFVYTLLLVGLAFFLARSSFQSVREQLPLLEAASLPDASMEQIQAMQAAAQIEPKNFQTLYNVGEALRARGSSVEENAQENLEAAIQWFQAAADIYPIWAFNYVGIGMTLDHLGRLDEATPYFQRAIQLDPNQHQVVAYMGWHQVNLGDYVAAKQYFDRSLEIKWWDNHIPLTYNRLIESRLPAPVSQTE